VVVAKSEGVLTALMKQFKAHTVQKTYLAIVRGKVKKNEGKIDLPLGRDQKDRKKISTDTHSPREAMTFYSVLQRFKGPGQETEASFVQLKPRTGRTHQIRVHLASLGNPVIGDKTYGGRYERNSAIKAERQMLHASTLQFTHPGTGKVLSFTAPLPADMKELLEQLTLLST
ncbi:MAG: RluA family pseudouridine synthase, partial [Nitrospirae bacterium]|nr:RluA family pseudouridine synthase [Nitrospirota bacterium]